MYKTWILTILLGFALFSGCVRAEEKGKSLFSSKGCVTCHKIQGIEESKGIDLTNVGSRLDSTAIKNKIKVCMPKLDISDKDTKTLVAYLSTLKSTTVAPTTVAPTSTTVAPTPTETKEKGKSWKGSATEADLVAVVNSLINNKGRNIDLAGKKHTITGKELLDVEISVLDCCTNEEFSDVIKTVSTCGKVKYSSFPNIQASVRADEIPIVDKIGNVMMIKFEPKAHDFWMKVIKQ